MKPTLCPQCGSKPSRIYDYGFAYCKACKRSYYILKRPAQPSQTSRRRKTHTPLCPKCNVPLATIYQPFIQVLKTGKQAGYGQRKQQGYCAGCRSTVNLTAKGGQVHHPTLPIKLPWSRQAKERCCVDCAGHVSHGSIRCQDCAVKARTFRPQDTPFAKYRARLAKAPGLTKTGLANLLAKWKKQGRLCAYCGDQPATTVDHVIPLVRGGDNYEGNCLPACRPCNSGKGARLIIEWRTAQAAARTKTTPRPKPPKPTKKPKPVAEKRYCAACGKRQVRTQTFCSRCRYANDPEFARQWRIHMRNKYRASVGLPPDQSDWIRTPDLLGEPNLQGDRGVSSSIYSNVQLSPEGLSSACAGPAMTPEMPQRARHGV